jgi:hypothetical protein
MSENLYCKVSARPKSILDKEQLVEWGGLKHLTPKS